LGDDIRGPVGYRTRSRPAGDVRQGEYEASLIGEYFAALPAVPPYLRQSTPPLSIC
jgi:hypothetical protein